MKNAERIAKIRKRLSALDKKIRQSIVKGASNSRLERLYDSRDNWEERLALAELRG